MLGLIAWIVGRANDPINRAASALAKEGARQRHESYKAKQERVHAELTAFVNAKKAQATNG